MSIDLKATHELATSSRADALVALALAQAVATKLDRSDREDIASVMEQFITVDVPHEVRQRFSEQVQHVISLMRNTN